MRACALFLGSAVVTLACAAPNNAPTDAGGPDAGALFVAAVEDFQGFDTWTRLEVHSSVVDAGTRFPGSRIVFMNRAPPSGSSEFPVGTIFVKINDNPDAGVQGEAYAMVKRGRDFNTAGAKGWEWFELFTEGTSTEINWRGEKPPDTGGYGPDQLTCNSCHVAARSNDFVLAAPLDLSRF